VGHGVGDPLAVGRELRVADDGQGEIVVDGEGALLR